MVSQGISNKGCVFKKILSYEWYFRSMIFLENEYLKVGISVNGAELKSIVKNGYEFMWQADENIWGRTAPILFPVVGKPFNNKLLINGKIYPMTQHGFARDMIFEEFEKSKTRIVFRLVSNQQTLAIYPYVFDLRVSYTIKENSIECGYEVRNRGNEMMFFSIGAHPGFNLPTKKLMDYFISFEQDENDERFLLSDGLLNGKSESVFNKKKLIDLDVKLFNKDAIVIKNIHSKSIQLKSKQNNFSIEMNIDAFPYFGIWGKQNCEEFICLEPWCGIAGSIGEQISFEQKEGINKLLPNDIFKRKYSIIFSN